MRLLDFLFPPRVDEIVLRNVSDDEFLAKVRPRLVPETRPGTVTLLSFGDESVRSAIHEAKYHGSERAFRLLGFVLADYLRDCDDVGLPMSHIVPVPLGKERLKERGFNQVEKIARCALRSLVAVPSHSSERRRNDHFILNVDLLERVKETQSQVSLERRRREKNMRGAFYATRRADPAHTYVVVDDVLTTGATLQACIDALKDVGAKHIIPLALAH